jgi:hypothetical protein
MATKKKAKRKSKKTAGKKATPAKKQARKVGTSKKSTKRATARRTTAPKKKVLKKKASRKTAGVAKKGTRKKTSGGGAAAFLRDVETRSGEQSGDLQGLSNVESADSESVDELLEEGNAFEAGVVTGVEDAGRRGVREVRTREVLEDDVPEEYLDQD